MHLQAGDRVRLMKPLDELSAGKVGTVAPTTETYPFGKGPVLGVNFDGHYGISIGRRVAGEGEHTGKTVYAKVIDHVEKLSAV